MKKIFAFLLLSVFALPFVAAQENVFAVGDKIVNVGIGFGSVLYSGLGYKTTVPPISVSFEKGFKDGVLEKGIIGIGGYIGYSAHKYDNVWWGQWKYSNLILAARGTFHYPLVDKFDTYAGLQLGYNIETEKETGTPTGNSYAGSGSRPFYSFLVGGRYYFNERFAGMAELGYGISWLNIGLAIKL